MVTWWLICFVRALGARIMRDTEKKTVVKDGGRTVVIGPMGAGKEGEMGDQVVC